MKLSGGAISWASRRQSIISQSTAEAEYVAACEACMKGQGLRNISIEVFPELPVYFTLGKDAYVMTTNPTYSRRTRHIELRWHYLRDQVTQNTVTLWKVSTEVNLSDLFIKTLAGGRLGKLCVLLGQHQIIRLFAEEVTSEGACWKGH